jgi:hypothetical protein
VVALLQENFPAIRSLYFNTTGEFHMLRITIEFTRTGRFTGNVYIAVGKREWFIGRPA